MLLGESPRARSVFADVLRLDPSIHDPSNIKRGDCYGLRGSSAPPEVVVLDVVNYPTFEVRVVMFGHLDMLTVADFPLVMAALKLEPMGRMTSPAPAPPPAGLCPGTSEMDRAIERSVKKFNTKWPASRLPPQAADNVAIETGRDVLTAALARAVWLAHDGRQQDDAAMLRSEEYATIHNAIFDALKEPEAREGLNLHADGLAATVDTSEQGERIYSLLQTIEEAAWMLDNERIVSDAQHLQEAMEHASKHLRKALTAG